MRCCPKLLLFTTVYCCFSLGTAKVDAALVVAGITQLELRPVQDIVLLPGTPFNQGTENFVLEGVVGRGTLTLDRQAQVGNTIMFTNGSFVGRGFAPGFGAFDFLGGETTPGFAVLENVQQDESHPGFDAGDPASIIGGDFRLTVTDYAVVFDDSGVRLEVRDPFDFIASFDGLPPSNGTQYISEFLTGPDSQLDVYLAGTDDIVGFTTNRTMTAVPEPGSMIALPIIAGLYVVCRRRRQKLSASPVPQA